MDKNQKMIYGHSLVRPTKWKAGGVNEQTLYFDCARCGAKAPKIAGFLSSREMPEFEDILLMPGKENPPKVAHLAPALFCKSCWPKIKIEYSLTPS
jgi:hypothetical protein